MECLVTLAMIGAGGVLLVDRLLCLSPRFGRWRTGYRLAAAHALMILGCLVVAPLYIWATWGSPYGDVYLPYLFVPGVHIYHPANCLCSGPLFQWLLHYTDSFPASLLCVIVGPGLIGVMVGGLQWWLIGSVCSYLARRSTG